MAFAKKELKSEEARAAVMRWLSRRTYSVTQIQTRLRERGVDHATAVQIAIEFEEHGWLCDARFAQSETSRLQSRKGNRYILHHLRTAGVDRDIATGILPDADSEMNRACAILQRKKFKSGLLPGEHRAAMYRFLINRGFTPAIALKASQFQGDPASE